MNTFSPSVSPVSRPDRQSGLLWLTCAYAAAFLAIDSDCSSSPAGLTREQQLYAVGTNVVGVVQQAAPVNSAAEMAAAVAAAASARSATRHAWANTPRTRAKTCEIDPVDGKPVKVWRANAWMTVTAQIAAA